MSDTIAERQVNAITRAKRYSPFLGQLIEREGELVAQLSRGDLPEIEPDHRLPVARRLRLVRRRLALTVAIGDLAGRLDLAGVTARLTAFADQALDAAIAAAIAERTPDVPARGFAAIALGKQGGGELNYSSDIDPIFLFDPDTLPHREREDVADAAVRIGRRVVELLQARDADGYVLRVDLRLRPSPEVTPIALPADAAIAYYESQALAWERAAFVRARAAAGDLVLGRRFLDAVRPFVWRRRLDFGAVRELRAISHRIRDHHSQGQAFGPGYDLKRGRGGIREVEFFAQIHQLIHGGRDPRLRVADTREALRRLAAAGWIAAAEADALIHAYTLLRTIEHRVQMIDDRQTHQLPGGEALDRIARLHGLDDGAALLALLRPHVAAVGRIYDSLEPAGDALSHDPVRLGEQLAAHGFVDDASHTIETWRAGRYPALRSAAAQAAMEAGLPAIAAALGEAPDPRTALLRLDAMLERLPSAINLFHLLAARPPLAALLATVLAHAPPLADALARQPALLDGLIDATALDRVGAVSVLVARMTVEGDYQARLDQVRHIVGETRFALGVQIIAGAADPLDVAAGYARLAEAAVETLAAVAVAEFARAYGHVPDSELLVLALGRLGGGALTHASDLDLIYVFTGNFTAQSDGAKPLGATLYYNRLAQRVTAALSMLTASGPLYPVDTRLRPSGGQGPLVVSLDSFARYQRQDAWTWEHMALTRARPVFGSASARQALQDVVDAVLGGERPARAIAADAIAMRADVTIHKPPAGPLDVKLLPGGLVDLEFAVHVTQLVHRIGFDPRLDVAIVRLAAAGLLPATLEPAYATLTRLLVTLRLVAPDAQPPSPGTQSLVARALGLPDWAAVIASLDATRQEVARCWRETSEDAR